MGSTTGLAVDISSCDTSALYVDASKLANFLSEAMYWRTCADIPATCGVAMDVPDL